ncbi:MAG: hypothetical protein ACIAS6_13185 [Phycisphaerales bacterium JB060]
MPRFPKNEAAFITYAKQRIADWKGGQAGPPDTGLSAQQLTDTENAVNEAESAYNAMLAARNSARTATGTKNDKLEALRAIFGADVDTIDAYAKATNNPGVYTLAGIPKPKDASEREAPPAPTNLRAVVDTDGSVDLTFKVAAGGGATYLVQRVLTPIGGAPGPYEFMGFANDDKTFTDNAVPEGIKSVGYRVSARLATGPQSSWSQTLIIPFGSQSNNPAGSIAPTEAKDQKDAG